MDPRRELKDKLVATVKFKDKPTGVDLEVENVAIRGCVDSGAPTTMADLEFFRTCGHEEQIVPIKDGRRWRSANGSIMDVKGDVMVNLKFGTTTINTKIVVVKSLIHDFLIGTDLMASFGFKIDYETNVLHIGESKLKMYVDGYDKAEVIRAPIAINLAPKSEQHVWFKSLVKGAPVIVEALEDCKVAVAEGLYRTDENGMFRLCVKNRSNECVNVRPGVNVCVLSMAQVNGFLADEDVATMTESVPSEKQWRPSESADINKKGLSDEMLRRYHDVIDKNWQAISREDSDIGKAEMTHEIRLRDWRPFKGRAYRLAPPQLAAVEQHVEEMLAMGVIRPSASEFASPIVLVKKSDGATRFCVDYRKLNDLTIKDNYPMPLMEERIDSIFGSKIFSTLDMTSGYWQFALSASAVQLTAFICHLGLFEFVRMPFGLCNAGATFQRAMESLLRGLKFAMAYIDDLLIHSMTHEDHVKHLDEVFGRLIRAGLKVKLRKCKFGYEETKFLGYVVSGEGIRISTEKTEKVANYPTPTSAKATRKFNGLSSYFKDFIPDYSTLNAPLQEAALMTKKDPVSNQRVARKFVWTAECQQAFESIKKVLTSGPFLVHPDMSKRFRLITDASGVGLGAVLAQLDDKGKERIITYAGRVLNEAEKNYSTSERELLAVKWAVRKFDCYLYGTPFDVFTDHRPLVHLKTSRNPSNRMLKWILELEEYDITYHYRPGKHNVPADVLSRASEVDSMKIGWWYERQKQPANPHQPIREWTAKSDSEDDEVSEESSEQMAVMTIEEVLSKKSLTEQQFEDESIKVLLSKCADDEQVFKRDEEGTLYLVDKLTGQWRIVLPKSLRKEVLIACHDGVGGSHLGRFKTLNKVAQRFFWTGMAEDVKDYVAGCEYCGIRKSPRMPREPNQQPLPVVVNPFDRVAVDFVGPLPVTARGNKYCLVFVDYATRWPEAFATKNMEAVTVASILIREILCRHGAPVQLLSDRGACFLSAVVKEVCQFMRSNKINTAAYHPQTNGLVERFNGDLMTMVTAYVGDNQQNWDLMLPIALFGYRVAVQESTKRVPAELLYARQIRLPLALDLFLPKLDFSGDIKLAFYRAQEAVANRAKKDKARHDAANKPAEYQVGDLVRVRQEALKVGQSSKLNKNRWSNPLEIKSIIGNNVVLDLKRKCNMVNIARVKRAEPKVCW